MLRALVLVVVLAAVAGTASAGRRCKWRPRIVFWSEAADLHDDGTWHRTIGTVETTGRLSPAALDRFRAAFGPDGGDAAPRTRCLDALIADEHGPRAKRDCVRPPRG